MEKQLQAVRSWHLAFRQPLAYKPTPLTPERAELRAKILQEEVSELKEAIEAGSMPEIAKELNDCLFVLFGTAVELGITDLLPKCFAEVVYSNFSKLDEKNQPVLREDGKVLKSSLYKPANMKQFFP